MLGAVLSDFYDQLTVAARDGLRDMAAHGTFERLRFLAQQHLQHVIADWQLMLLSASLQRDQTDYAHTDAYRLNREYTLIFDDIVSDGIARGDVREEIPVWILRDQFFGALEYMVRTLILRGREGEYAEAIDRLLQTMQTGMQAPATTRKDRDTNKLKPLVTRLEAAVARLEVVKEG